MDASNTIESIYSVLGINGFGARIVSVRHLDALKGEIQLPYYTGTIDDVFYNERLTHFQFIIPDSSSRISSIIITSAPQPLQRVSFQYKGKQYNLIIPPTYSYKTDKIVESLILDVIKPKGYKLYPTSLPLKLLAVHSGLARYGRNNIAYAENAGSFNRLKAFYSDIPANEDNWGNYKMLEHCENCSVCIKKCPTGAITPDRFTIKAERCLTFHNERLSSFPDWIEDSESFNEQETGLILNGNRYELTDGCKKKLERLDLLEDFDLIPRNLYALITRE